MTSRPVRCRPGRIPGPAFPSPCRFREHSRCDAAARQAMPAATHIGAASMIQPEMARELLGRCLILPHSAAATRWRWQPFVCVPAQLHPVSVISATYETDSTFFDEMFAEGSARSAPPASFPSAQRRPRRLRSMRPRLPHPRPRPAPPSLGTPRGRTPVSGGCHTTPHLLLRPQSLRRRFRQPAALLSRTSRALSRCVIASPFVPSRPRFRPPLAVTR
jgi:hypothetical protein